MQPQVRQSRYTEIVLTLWENVLTYSSEARLDIVNKQIRSGTMAYRTNRKALIVSLVEIWEELQPKIEGTNLESRYNEFESYIHNPNLFLKNPNKIFELKAIIRKALEIAGITKIEVDQ